MKMSPMRTGNLGVSVAARAVLHIAFKNGSATVAPRPRKTARREIGCFGIMKCGILLSDDVRELEEINPEVFTSSCEVQWLTLGEPYSWSPGFLKGLWDASFGVARALKDV